MRIRWRYVVAAAVLACAAFTAYEIRCALLAAARSEPGTANPQVIVRGLVPFKKAL